MLRRKGWGGFPLSPWRKFLQCKWAGDHITNGSVTHFVECVICNLFYLSVGHCTVLFSLMVPNCFNGLRDGFPANTSSNLILVVENPKINCDPPLRSPHSHIPHVVITSEFRWVTSFSIELFNYIEQQYQSKGWTHLLIQWSLLYSNYCPYCFYIDPYLRRQNYGGTHAEQKKKQHKTVH